MKRIQKLLLKLRDPSPAVLILLIICSTVLLIYTFTREAPNPGIQYFSYLFSAHTLVVLCIAAPRIAKKIYAALLRVNIFRRYKTDAEFRMQLGLYTGLGINLAFVVFKFCHRRILSLPVARRCRGLLSHAQYHSVLCAKKQETNP